MPGPQATSRSRREPAKNSPPPKIRARLAARQAGMVAGNGYHLAGSQNRKK